MSILVEFSSGEMVLFSSHLIYPVLLLFLGTSKFVSLLKKRKKKNSSDIPLG